MDTVCRLQTEICLLHIANVAMKTTIGAKDVHVCLCGVSNSLIGPCYIASGRPYCNMIAT